MNHFKAIAAMSDNRVIGMENSIPWRIPEDLAWFQRMTTGQIIVVGRKTYESIGKALPRRATFVLSRSGGQIPGARVISSLQEIDLAHEARQVFICGGAQVYAQALPFCSDLYLTLVKRRVDGDAYFPPFEEMFDLVETITDKPEFRISHYRNRILV